MLDIPGGHGKIPIESGYLADGEEEDAFYVTDRKGQKHIYPPLERDE
jgi:lysine 2,3-aminomutase